MVKKSDYKKVTLTMPDDMLVYLETIGQKSHRKGGLKFAKTEVVRAFLVLLDKLDIDFTGLKDKDDLQQRIIKSMKAYLQKGSYSLLPVALRLVCQRESHR